MPLSVMQDVRVDFSLPLSEIAPLLVKLSHENVEEEGRYPVPDELEIESRIVEQIIEGEELIAGVERLGRISTLTCPDCHGALWEIKDEDMLRYRCHVGHAYSAESLNEGQTQMLEIALWSAIRALEEQMILAKRIVEGARQTNRPRAAQVFEKRAQEAEAHSSVFTVNKHSFQHSGIKLDGQPTNSRPRSIVWRVRHRELPRGQSNSLALSLRSLRSWHRQGSILSPSS
jgi:two-component system, chemotaxis family, protein-glutamate methylesterase/glutaminase